MLSLSQNNESSGNGTALNHTDRRGAGEEVGDKILIFDSLIEFRGGCDAWPKAREPLRCVKLGKTVLLLQKQNPSSVSIFTLAILDRRLTWTGNNQRFNNSENTEKCSSAYL